jgi:4-hydroxy-tetrahydrodipicolinate synthase
MSRRFPDFRPRGVIPAALLPFKSDLSIDEPALRRHILHIANTEGINSICVNGSSQEAFSLTLEEQQRNTDIILEEIGDRVPLVMCVYAHGGRDGAEIARRAERWGASSLLVFPPAIFNRGSQLRPEMTIDHYKAIADATDLPLIIFQFEMSSGQGHTLDTLVRLAEEVPSVVAMKDRCNVPLQHERNIRTLQNLPRPVDVLTTHSAWLLSSLVLGCNGILSGSGSIIADLHVALWQAVQRNDLVAARALNDRIFPLANCFYSDPVLDMHNRMKEALVMLGRIPNASVRLPWVKVSEAERTNIKLALERSGLLSKEYRIAA